MAIFFTFFRRFPFSASSSPSLLQILCPKLHYTHLFALIEFFPHFFSSLCYRSSPIPVVDNTCRKTLNFHTKSILPKNSCLKCMLKRERSCLRKFTITTTPPFAIAAVASLRCTTTAKTYFALHIIIHVIDFKTLCKLI